jgi:ABC-type antimicrobial peptide transport system permease subunit
VKFAVRTALGASKFRAQLYFPFMQLPDTVMALTPSGMRVAVRSRGPAPAVVDSIRNSLQQMNSKQVVYDVQTMEEIISSSIASQWFSMILLGAFAGLALLLSSIGIYGVISYLVDQQAREIGIRIALGAQRRDVLQWILGTGAKMALLGVAIGLVAAFGLTRLMGGMLHRVTATEPLTFFVVSVLLIVVALAAIFRRGARMHVDPLVALRYE